MKQNGELRRFGVALVAIGYFFAYVTTTGMNPISQWALIIIVSIGAAFYVIGEDYAPYQ